MAALQSHSSLLSFSAFRPSQLPLCRGRWRTGATLRLPLIPKSKSTSLPILSKSLITMEEGLTRTEQRMKTSKLGHKEEEEEEEQDNNSLIITKLLAVAEAAADRAEMHAIIGEQRNNWNHLFLHSINSITLTAALMSGFSAIPDSSTLPLGLSSAVLFASAAGLMLLVNKIQPSQLAEEQRNAARLFKQLERSIRATVGLGGAATESDVEEGMEMVLALQKAYPLPLLPGMLEKFPKTVEPTKWWPKLRQRRMKGVGRNGWGREMEEEMRGVARVLRVKDEEQYLRLSKLVRDINKFLAFAGPLLAGIAAAGAAASSVGIGHGSLPAVAGGALAAVVNTMEHGGQVGMVFELFRNCAGFYRRLEEEIEFNLGEEEKMREQGEIFEVKMALQLGRSLSELRELAEYDSPASCEDDEINDFAGKLF